MTAPNRPTTSLRTLHLIRLSIFGGALLFGIVTWWLRRETPPPMAMDMGPLRFVGYALWVSVLVVLAFVRGLFGKAVDQARSTTLLIIAWAAGESLALFGGVVWFLHGDSRWFVAGMCFMLATFILFPLARE
jgi:hypothetical protein